jgi:transcription initiation protein SPT3
MSAEDLIFLIRYDHAKVNRLKTYLSWKDVRKNAKDTGGNDAAEEILKEPNAGLIDY